MDDTMRRVRPRAVMLCLLAATWTGLSGQSAGLPAGQPAMQEQDVRSVGAKGLLLTYRCLPSVRPALREYLLKTEVPRLAALERSGVLSGSKVLFSQFIDTANWDLMIFLSFPSPARMTDWIELERTSPAGFDAQGLKLVSDIATYPLDLVEQGKSPQVAGKPVYMVVPYDYTVSTEAYLQYLKGYVVPQTEGWIAAGPLASYSIYVGRDVAGRPWSSLLMLEYRDQEAFGRRGATVAAVRARLKDDPAWKAISDNKQSVRVEKAPFVAEEIR